MFKSRHLGYKHTNGPLEAAGCLLSSPVMSCSESIDLIDGADSDQRRAERAYSRCLQQLYTSRISVPSEHVTSAWKECHGPLCFLIAWRDPKN
jgi:hypothetical protein